MAPRDRIQLIAMSVLAALFVARVAAQLVQAIFPLSWLPPFEVWHSGVLPYTLLLACQLCIIGLMSYCLHAVRSGWKRPRRWKYRGCFAFGGVYFAFMAFRWIAGVTFLAEHSWFARTLPAFFHLVLASFILLLGLHIYGRLRYPRIFRSSGRR